MRLRPIFRTQQSIGERLCCTQTICPAPSVPKLTEKQGPNLPGAGSRDISWMPPSKPAVPGAARRERGP